ncbi:MAG: RNA polymerase sigma factor [Bacteroidia bacterium]|nr:RNA polymerase sigma factor [Bacteroidia bacterium]
MSLEQLVILAAEGKEQAQKQLFLKTSSQLKAVALRYVRDVSTADDVLQESYIRIFNQLTNFEYINDESTIGWMRKITAREAIRIIKKDQRWLDNNKSNFTPEIQNSNPMMMDDMYQMLMRLPDNQRVVFNLVAIEGYSHKEIASELGIEKSSSRSLLTRARKNLQNILTKKMSYEKV